MQILLNKIRTPDGTELTSTYRHDYITYEDDNGFTYMVDGGKEYLRRNIYKSAPYTELSVTTDSNHSEIRDCFTWKSYGKVVGSNIRIRKLKVLSEDHIRCILDTCALKAYVRKLMENELKFREKEL